MINPLKQVQEKSMLPMTDAAIMLDDRLLVVDNLEYPATGMENGFWNEYKNCFPVKLPLDCILLVIKGSIRFSVNFMEHEVSDGMCAAISSGTIIEHIDLDEDTKFVMLLFSRQDLSAKTSSIQPVHRLYCLPVVIVPLLQDQQEVLLTTYRMLRTILTKVAFESHKEETASCCISLMISIIWQSVGDSVQPGSKSTRKDEIVSRFLQSVADNYRSHRELSFYANELGLSLKYMSHVIHEQTGRHPSQLIKDYVILDAKTMLRSGRYSVQQVSDELNFPNQSFFGKYFKEAVGVSPKKWK